MAEDWDWRTHPPWEYGLEHIWGTGKGRQKTQLVQAQPSADIGGHLPSRVHLHRTRRRRGHTLDTIRKITISKKISKISSTQTYDNTGKSLRCWCKRNSVDIRCDNRQHTHRCPDTRSCSPRHSPSCRHDTRSGPVRSTNPHMYYHMADIVRFGWDCTRFDWGNNSSDTVHIGHHGNLACKDNVHCLCGYRRPHTFHCSSTLDLDGRDRADIRAHIDSRGNKTLMSWCRVDRRQRCLCLHYHHLHYLFGQSSTMLLSVPAAPPPMCDTKFINKLLLFLLNISLLSTLTSCLPSLRFRQSLPFTSSKLNFRLTRLNLFTSSKVSLSNSSSFS